MVLVRNANVRDSPRTNARVLTKLTKSTKPTKLPIGMRNLFIHSFANRSRKYFARQRLPSWSPPARLLFYRCRIIRERSSTQLVSPDVVCHKTFAVCIPGSSSSEKALKPKVC